MRRRSENEKSHSWFFFCLCLLESIENLLMYGINGYFCLCFEF